eukprot:568896-Prorocentrum_minimum.AAC.1
MATRDAAMSRARQQSLQEGLETDTEHSRGPTGEHRPSLNACCEHSKKQVVCCHAPAPEVEATLFVRERLTGGAFPWFSGRYTGGRTNACPQYRRKRQRLHPRYPPRCSAPVMPGAGDARTL